jgi:hypothetical protein
MVAYSLAMREHSAEPNRSNSRIEAAKKHVLSAANSSERKPFLCAMQHSLGGPKPRFKRVGNFSSHFSCLLAVIVLYAAGGARAVTLGWNSVTNVPVSGYRVYQGKSSRLYTQSTNVGNVTQATINGLSNGVTYYFAATAVSSSGVESDFSAEFAYTVPLTTNTAPTIQLTSPGGTLFTEPASVSLAASVVPNGHAVTKVQFYNGSALLGESSTAPYSYTWNNVLAGNYNVTARLIYDQGSVLDSSPVAIGVVAGRPPPSDGPTVVLTSPTNGSALLAQTEIDLAAAVTLNGFTVSKVQFYSGSNLLSESTTSPFTAVWTNATPGTYTLTARAIYDAGSTTDSPPVTIIVTDPAALPPPWLTSDIGTKLAGNATTSNGVYTLSGAGTISGSLDGFRFLYQPLSANGEIRAQITSFSNGGSGGLAGVMIRENLTAGSKYSAMGIAPDGTIWVQRRTKTNSKVSGGTYGTRKIPNAWVRVVRTINGLASYSSSDGVSWALVDSRSVSMASEIYIGLIVDSGQSGALANATFANVRAVP